MASLYLKDFSGGLNARDQPNELSWSPLETPAADNWTLDERGGLKLRNGCASAGSLPGVTGKKRWLFYSAMLGQFLCAVETTGAPNTLKLHTATSFGTWTDRGTINTSVSAKAAFVDFPGTTPKVVITTNVKAGATEGIFTWDGTTLTDLAAGNTVAGDAIALWQNKVWVAGYPNSDADGDPTLLRWCDAGDPTTWTSTNTQRIRDKDAQQITGLAVIGGGLIVFKRDSAYRVTDSSSGAYQMIDATAGCVNPRAVTVSRGRGYSWSTNGMYSWDGTGPGRSVGDKIRTYYDPANVDWTTVAAGTYQQKVYFYAVLFAGAKIIEYDTQQGWLMRHVLAVSTGNVSTFTVKDEVLYGAIYNIDKGYTMFTATAGQDESTLFSSSFNSWRTPWLQPNSGMLARLQRVVVQGLIGSLSGATLDMKVYKGWDRSSPSDTYSLTANLATSSANIDELFSPVMSVGHSTAFALEFQPGTAAATTRVTGLQLVDTPLQYPNPGYPQLPGRPSTPTAPVGAPPQA